jgi:hypothetical protein
MRVLSVSPTRFVGFPNENNDLTITRDLVGWP